jgi:hypothetical protein
VTGSGGSSGATGAGGRGGSTGAAGTTGAAGRGGATGAAGAAGRGGTTGAAGTMGGAGAAGGGGAAGAGSGPCDIYQAAGAPCVAAHSTTRALYAAYGGPIYQVRKGGSNTGTGGTTKDIMPLAPGGVVDSSAQDAFCAGSTCTISIIYDQSSYKNHLKVAPVSAFMPMGGLEADATGGQTTLGGHKVYGIYVTGLSNYIANRRANVGYRIIKTTGVATGLQAESMYMVLDGKRYGGACCFDYGNAETTPTAGANMTMEAIYWGTDTYWGGPGDGKGGPWICADFENGMYKGDSKGTIPSNMSIKTWPYVTAMLKGYAENRFVLKGGSAQAGKLQVEWDGKRPAGYETKMLEGSIILGTGGDGSPGCDGTFWEGVMTIGVPPDSADDAVQANIVAAGYGR